MANIRPFKAIRPREDLADKIAALPYDVYSRKEAKEKVQGDTYTFLRIDRPETQFEDDFDMYSKEAYQKAHDMLWDMVSRGEFVQDDTAIYYVYEQIMDSRSQTGIVAVASADDYDNAVIKKHENTREEKELDRICHVDVCNAQTGPIFLAYRRNEIIRDEILKAKKEKPVYQFVSDDGISHSVWCITDSAANNRIKDAFAGIDSIYIADGHHRCASAVKVCKKRRAQYPEYTGEEEFNFFLSVLFADEELMIMDYNRVVKDLNGNTKEEFMDKVAEKFELSEISKNEAKPTKKGTFGMFIDGKWYLLTYKGCVSNDPVEALDVSVLQNELLEPVLGILDPKTDNRIDFVGGIRGMAELEKRVNSDCVVAFSMYPTSISELFEVADAGKLMPPKSTWFEPKLRSGLFIHGI